MAGTREDPIDHAATPNTLAYRWYFDDGGKFIWQEWTPGDAEEVDRDWFTINGEELRLSKWRSTNEAATCSA